jgi:hypothetical protein
MAIKKEYSQDYNQCKVTFILPKNIADSFNSISVVGDFNQWDHHKNIFTEKEVDGSYSISIILESKNAFQFRYLADGIHWFNEEDADDEIEGYYEGSRNSIIVI